jgi:PilZ domain
MEGPIMRHHPRTEEDCQVAVRNGDKLDRVSKGLGNLSVGGIFARVSNLPVGSHVTVEVGGNQGFAAEGIVRYSLPAQGIGIEFVPGSQHSIREHIADLTRRGMPAA